MHLSHRPSLCILHSAFCIALALSASAQKFVEYIESNSDRLAYIDTGYTPNANTEIEMDFAFFMEPDSVVRRDSTLEIQTAKKTVNTVYTYVESLCKKTFGKGKNAPDGALPVPSLLFPELEAGPSLTRLRVYTLPDAGKTDVIVHLVANGEYSVNYVILRQMEK